MSFACQSFAIFMPIVCTRMSHACHSYVTRMCLYLIYMYSYAIRMSVVCTRMSSVCHSYVLVCHPYVTRMYSYVIRMSLVCTCMSSICHSYVGLPWTFKQPVRNIESLWKYALKWTRYLISIFIVSFDQYEHVLVTLEKQINNFPRLYSWSSLCCHYEISNLSLQHRNFLPRNPEISVWWFLLKSVLKQRYEHCDDSVSEIKWKPCY